MSLAALTTLVNTVTTNAAFRTWGLAYNAKLAAAGLIQTADTGQVDWTTVTAAIAVNTVQGYEIWRFDDALQSSCPIFIKVEYGSGSSVNNGSNWITLGNATNGAGTLSGVTSTRQQVTCTATAGAINHYWSGDTSRFGVAAVGASSSSSSAWFIERTIDTSGVVTNEGALLISRGSGSWAQQAWNQSTGPYTATWESSLGAMGAAVAPFGSFSLQVAIYPIFHNKGIFMTPGLNAFVYENAQIPAASSVSFSVYGTSHTFMPLGSTAFGNPGRGGFLAAALMMRYE